MIKLKYLFTTLQNIESKYHLNLHQINSLLQNDQKETNFKNFKDVTKLCLTNIENGINTNIPLQEQIVQNILIVCQLKPQLNLQYQQMFLDIFQHSFHLQQYQLCQQIIKQFDFDQQGLIQIIDYLSKHFINENKEFINQNFNKFTQLLKLEDLNQISKIIIDLRQISKITSLSEESVAQFDNYMYDFWLKKSDQNISENDILKNEENIYVLINKLQTTLEWNIKQGKQIQYKPLLDYLQVFQLSHELTLTDIINQKYEVNQFLNLSIYLKNQEQFALIQAQNYLKENLVNCDIKLIFKFFISQQCIDLDLLQMVENSIQNEKIPLLTTLQLYSTFPLEIPWQIKNIIQNVIKKKWESYQLSKKLTLIIYLYRIEKLISKPINQQQYQILDNELINKIEITILGLRFENLNQFDRFKVYFLLNSYYEKDLLSNYFNTQYALYINAYLSNEFKTLPRIQSLFQKEIEQCLIENNIQYKREILIENSFSIDFLIKKNTVIEVNGPYHYCTLLGTSLPKEKLLAITNTSAIYETLKTSLKTKILTNKGYKVINIPYFKWNGWKIANKQNQILLDMLQGVSLKDSEFLTSKTFSHIRTRPQSTITYDTKKNEKISPSGLKMMIPIGSESNDLDKFVLKTSPNKFRTLSTRKTNIINESSITQSKTNHTEIAKNSPVVQELVKKIPLNMQKDKDDLYTETVYLKDVINKLTQDNYDLKAKLRFLNKNTERMVTVVQNVGGYLQQKYVGADKQDLAVMTKLGISENLLTITLKKQIKELRKLIKQQTEEILKLKHDIKYTNIQEFEKQINVQQEESLRLRTLLEQSQRNEQIMQMSHDFNQYEEKFYLQMQIINSLKQENSFYQGQLQIEQEEQFKLNNQIENNQKIINKNKQIIDDLSQTLKDKLVFIEELQMELNSYKETNQNLVQKANKLDNNQLRIEGLIKIEQDLKKELQQKTRDIEYLDKTTTELKQKLNERSAVEVKIKDQLQEEVKKLKAAYEELDEKYKHLLLINAQSRLKETVPSIQQRQAPQALTVNIQTQRPINQNNTLQNSMDKNQQQQKFKVIKKQDVEQFGLELNYRLRIKKITLSDAIERFLFDNKNKKTGEIKLKELSDRLQKEPFSLVDEDSALLVARYLTEDNTLEFVVYNDQLTQSTTIVRSILSKLVGEYILIQQEEEIKKTKEITLIISKYKNSLKQHFDQLPSKYEGLLEKKQIIETFEYMDIDLTADQYDFLFLKLFSYSNNTQIFPYIRIFEIFQEIATIERVDSDKKKKARKKDTKEQQAFTRRQTFEIAN